MPADLRAHQRLRITNVRPQIGRHLARVLKKTRKDSAVSVDDRILVIEHVERRGAVVRVDHDFDAVANVVERVSRVVVMRRVRKVTRLGKSVEHPEEPAFTRNYDVSVFVVSQKRSDAVYDVANVSIDQDPAIARY